MPKSVFQQLVEQTCSNANFKPSNNKAQQSPASGKSNGHSSPSKSDGSPTDLTPRPAPAASHSKLETRNSKLVEANASARCQHIKTNGVRCKSPAMRTLNFCFYHEKIHNPPYEESFPALEDANSVQLALLQVLNGVKYKSITLTEARVMIYALKAASINVRRTNFDPPLFDRQVTEFPSWYRQADMPKPEDYTNLAAINLDSHPERSETESRGNASKVEEPIKRNPSSPDKKEPVAIRTARSASASASRSTPATSNQQLATVSS